jgi:hypothetical protein
MHSELQHPCKTGPAGNRLFSNIFSSLPLNYNSLPSSSLQTFSPSLSTFYLQKTSLYQIDIGLCRELCTYFLIQFLRDWHALTTFIDAIETVFVLPSPP